ncbi:MAG: hypothetical protein WCG25_02545 [bacterium]
MIPSRSEPNNDLLYVNDIDHCISCGISNASCAIDPLIFHTVVTVSLVAF